MFNTPSLRQATADDFLIPQRTDDTEVRGHNKRTMGRGGKRDSVAEEEGSAGQQTFEDGLRKTEEKDSLLLLSFSIF